MAGILFSLWLVAMSAPPVRALDVPVMVAGRLTENVESTTFAGQRFSIYLPRGFDATRPTPVIYLLDPRGRARVPARVFQEGAERYGYILISSQTSTSDAAMEPNLMAMQAMWDDANRWFTIDPRRTYVAGFSGTARMASLIGRHRPITGVIGSGAGFHPDVKPTRALPFLYFGGIGEVDYNFHEIEKLEDALAAENLPHRIERFPGPHAWMTPAIGTRAIEWMELRAMQSGARTVETALVDTWWTRDDEAARASLGAGRLVEAARRYAAMARDYAGLRDVSGVARAAARLAASPDARAQLARKHSETRLSDGWVEDSLQAVADAFPEGQDAPDVPVPALARSLGLARLKATAAGNTPAALEARRRLNQLEVQLGFYLPAEALARLELNRADYYLSLAMHIDDTSPVSWYLRAQWCARLKDGRGAVAALRRAVDAGFRDLTLLASDRAFERLRGNGDYRALIEDLGRLGDTRDVLTVDRPPVHVRR